MSSPARVVSPLLRGPEVSVPQVGNGRGVDRDRWKHTSVSFAILLETCSELDRAAKMLKERGQRTGIHLHLPRILHAIDALCGLCAAFIYQDPAPCPKDLLDPVILALVIAANVKVLVVCAVLVSLRFYNLQRPHVAAETHRFQFHADKDRSGSDKGAENGIPLGVPDPA